METVVSCPVKLTEGAIAEIRRLMAQPEYEQGKSLRIGVKGGGCSGMTYILDFDIQTPEDETFEIDGIKVLMNPSHAMYLWGMEVDYQLGLNSRGFVFNNPNASKTCGCGTSFAV